MDPLRSRGRRWGLEPIPGGEAGPSQSSAARAGGIKEELFAQAIERLSARRDDLELQAALQGVQLLDWADSTLHLEVASAFVARLFDRVARGLLERALQDLAGASICVRLHIADGGGTLTRRWTAAPRSSTLSDFVTDEPNRMAYRVLMSYRDGRPLFDPCLLFGTSGAGKTHLLRGFERAARETGGPEAARYITGAAFGRAFRATLYRHRLEAFRSEMDTPDVLLLDELDRLQTMPSTQREVVRMLERRSALGRSTVFASPLHPHEMHELDPTLVTRLMGGMVVKMAAVRPERLAQELKARLLKRGVRVEPDVLARAVTLSGGVPTVAESLVLAAHREAQQARRPLTADEVASPEPTRGEPTLDRARMRRLTDEVGSAFGVSPADLESPRKVRRAQTPRKLLALVLRDQFGMSSAEIGRRLGGRSVSTVTKMLRHGRELLDEDPAVREMFDLLVSPKRR